MVKLHNKDTLTAPIYILLLLYRGDVFRMALSRIGEIRSIIPPNVHVMALTATATRITRAEVLKRLNMQGCEMVCRSPHKGNICLHVKEKPDLAVAVMPIVENLKQCRATMNRTIIYCKRHKEVMTIY